MMHLQPTPLSRLSRRLVRVSLQLALPAMLLAGCGLGRPPGPPVTAFDGSYAGGSTILEDISDACTELPPIDDFNVRDGQLQYYGFRGWVHPSGTVTAQSGDAFVTGKFSNGGFVGHTYSPGGPCTYRLTLHKVS